jgi:hypothetical protein
MIVEKMLMIKDIRALTTGMVNDQKGILENRAKEKGKEVDKLVYDQRSETSPSILQFIAFFP